MSDFDHTLLRAKCMGLNVDLPVGVLRFFFESGRLQATQLPKESTAFKSTPTVTLNQRSERKFGMAFLKQQFAGVGEALQKPNPYDSD